MKWKWLMLVGLSASIVVSTMALAHEDVQDQEHAQTYVIPIADVSVDLINSVELWVGHEAHTTGALKSDGTHYKFGFLGVPLYATNVAYEAVNLFEYSTEIRANLVKHSGKTSFVIKRRNGKVPLFIPLLC